jgi:hypothetical protein
MRNYNSKTFIPPSPLNSFQKSDRIYPEPVNVKSNPKKNYMIIEPQQQ